MTPAMPTAPRVTPQRHGERKDHPGDGAGRRAGDHRRRRGRRAVHAPPRPRPGRDPMILYRHAPNKAALLDGVAETLLAQLPVDPADPDWAAQLRAVARHYRALALAHPHVVPLLVTRPLATPLALRPRHPAPARRRPRPAHPGRVHRTRRPAHLPGPVGFLHGHILNELQELIDNPDETDDLLRLGLHRLPIRDFPCCATSPPPWPPTTAPPNSNAASTSCSPDSPPH